MADSFSCPVRCSTKGSKKNTETLTCLWERVTSFSPVKYWE